MGSFSLRKHYRTGGFVLFGKQLLSKSAFEMNNALTDSCFVETDVYLRRIAKQLGRSCNSKRRKLDKEAYLHLDLHPNFPPQNFQKQLLRACRNNRTVQHVSIRVGAHQSECHYMDTDLPAEGWWKEEDIRSLSQAIFSLSELKSLEIQFDMEDSTEVVPFYELFDALDRTCSQLERLQIDDLHLTESSYKAHLDSLSCKLRQVCSLQSLRMSVKSERMADIALDDFFDSLSRLPNLKEIEISDRGMQHYMLGGLSCSGRALADFVSKAPKLEKIKIFEDSFSFQEQDILQVILAIRDHPSLKSAEIFGGEGKKIGNHEVFSSKICEALLLVLKDNFSLETLSIYARKTDNYHLYEKKIASLLRMNRAGRGLLMQDTYAPREQWLGKLISLRNDVDSSFQLLTANPSILTN